MGNSHSGSNRTGQMNISIYDIIDSAGQHKSISIKRCISDIDSDSPKSVSSNDSCIATSHSNISLNLECYNFDVITHLRISDTDSKIDHIDLMLGHRRFKAVRDGNDLIICIPIPKFILSDTSPLRLDIYPKTQENPDEISYCYDGYILDGVKKEQYLTSRIEDKSTHIMYVDGLVC